MKKERAQQWIKTISRQPFPVVSFEQLKTLYEIAEEEYPKHDYLVASNSLVPNEIKNAIEFELKKG